MGNHGRVRFGWNRLQEITKHNEVLREEDGGLDKCEGVEMIKICVECQNEFIPTNNVQKYCKSCAARVQRRQTNEAWQKKKEENRIERKSRPLLIVKCEGCGADVMSKTNQKRFCKKCFLDKYKEGLAEKKKLRHLGGMNMNKNFKCPICGIEVSSHYNKKYCEVCRELVLKERNRRLAKQRAELLQEYFRTMPKEEQLRRMELISKKLLEEEE